MGLREQILAGATNLKRETVGIVVGTASPRITGSVSIGRSFVLTAIQASTRCRVRLYGDSGSRNDPGELIRPFNSQSIPSNISLITDINLDTETLFRLAPPIFGLNLDNAVSPDIYYTIDTGSSFPLTGEDRISLTRFLIEDTTVTNLAGVNARQTLTLPSATISSGSSVTGSIVSPKTYLLYKVEPNASPLRLRLYTSASYRDNPSEVSRSFNTDPVSSSGLIADIYMEDSSAMPLSPIIVGRNDNDLVNNIVSPSSETYYRLTNGAATSTVSASLFVFSLED